MHAGEKEVPRAAARADSRKEAEPRHTGRAARESKQPAEVLGAAEAPSAAKEAAVRASQPVSAAHASAPARSEASSQHPLGLGMWCMGAKLANGLNVCRSGSSSVMCSTLRSSGGVGLAVLMAWGLACM